MSNFSSKHFLFKSYLFCSAKILKLRSNIFCLLKNKSSSLRDRFPIIVTRSVCKMCSNCQEIQTGMNRVLIKREN